MTHLESLDDRIRPLAERLIELCKQEGIIIRLTSGRRTIQQQNMLYAQGRTMPGRIVTNAKGGASPHNFGLAFDVVPIKDGKPDWNAPLAVWDRIGELGKSLGLTWGGDFKTLKDRPHFELPIWKTVRADWLAGKIQVA